MKGRHGFAIAAGIALTGIVAALVVGVPVDAAPWRDAIARAASAALGRPVALDGPLELRLSAAPAMRVAGLTIANPPGFASAEFASLGDARIELALAPLLSGTLRFRALEARDGRLRLERASDGRGNWRFAGQAAGGQDEASTGGAPAMRFEIGRIDLRNLTLEYFDARTGATRYFDLERLAGTAARDAAFSLTLRGRVDKSFPYELTVTGDPAGRLYGGEPWPFTLDFAFLGTRLHASGTIDPGRGETRALFGLGTEDLAEIERFLQARLPKFGVAALSGELAARGGTVEATNLRGVLGESQLAGHLAFSTRDGRAAVRGALEAATLDVRPFLAADAASARTPLTYADIAGRPLDLGALSAADVALDLAVGSVAGVPFDVRDAHLALKVERGAVTAPIVVTLAGVRLGGALAADAAASVPAVSVALWTGASPLGGLATALTGLPGIEGSLARFSLAAGGRGATIGALVQSLDFAVRVEDARLSYGNVAGGRPVALALERLEAALPAGGRFAASARGRLLGEGFTAEARGGDLDGLLRSVASPIDMRFRGAGADVRAAGRVARPGAETGSDLTIDASAPRAGSLAPWLGVSPQAAMPLSLRGRARIESDEVRLDDLVVKLGRSELVVNAHETGIGARPFVVASVTSPLIDAAELEALAPPAGAARTARATLDIPILPQRVSLAEADIGLGLARVAFRRFAITNAGFAARLREGRMAPSPWVATVAEVPFTGDAALDLRGELPQAALTLTTGAVDVGALLARLGIAQGIEASAEGLRAGVTLVGARVGEIAERSAFAAALAGGRLRIPGAGGKTLADIAVREAALFAAPGERVAARVAGTLGDAPIAIDATSGTLAELAREAGRVPFAARAEAAGATLALDGTVRLPFGSGGADLVLEVAGERLDSLAPLARAELPPWGPWSVAGPIRITASAYEAPKLAVRVGSSRLEGSARVDVSGARPRIDARVAAREIQLDDFRGPRREGAQALDAEALRAKAKEAAARGESLASPAVLRRFDAFADVQVERVLSGPDRLGDGRLVAQVDAGRLTLGPAIVNVPGGTLTASVTYEPGERGVAVAAGAYADNFEYGILARRARPGSDLAGKFSLRLEIASRAPSLDAVMAHANGTLDVAVWPQRLAAGVFDLWAVNVFAALVPELDPDAASRVNCAVGRFDIRDGRLTPEAMLIDTSRMRVAGEGAADFRDETLSFRFQPRAKEPQLFSLATPVAVTGTLTAPKIGASPGDIAATALRFLGSAVLFPFYLVPEGRLPRDGADICADPLRATEKARR